MAETRVNNKNTVKQAGDLDIVIAREFDAPRELVWQAWTEPGLIKKWWGPRGFTAPVIKNDLRVGGKSLYDMRSPDGKDFWSTGTYREIVPMERIVTTDSFADEQGHVVPATYYGFSEDFPRELLLTITFEERRGKTRLTLRHTGFPTRADRDDAETGWNESLDKLARSLVEPRVKSATARTTFTAEPGKQEVAMTAFLDAPRDKVYQAYVDPKLIPQWWGPASLTTRVDKIDVRPGGIWRFIQRDARGNEFAFHGFYHLVSPERMVYTFEFEGAPGQVMLETAEFIEYNGKTKVVVVDVFQSLADRDAAVQSGMEAGATDSMERFAEVLKKNE